MDPNHLIIKALTITGFRSLRDVHCPLDDLNIVIGPNGAGKSNLLRCLELISTAARGGLGKLIQTSGGMNALVWDGRTDRILFDLFTRTSTDSKAVLKEYSYSLELVQLGNSSAFRVDHEHCRVHGLTDHQDKGPRGFDRNASHAFLHDGSGTMAPPLVALSEFADEGEAVLSAAFGPKPFEPLIILAQRAIQNWCVYHDVEVYRNSAIRQAPVVRWERQVAPDGENLINVIHTLYTEHRAFRDDINGAMNAAFDGNFDELVFSPAADQRIQLRVRWKNFQRLQSASDLSDGTLRFLFLMTVLANPSSPALIAIDEPETGLHPSMFPIIAEFAAETSQRTQLIFTTHSPQFLDAFKTTTPSTIVASCHNGETILKSIAGDELKEWLKTFSLGTLFVDGDLEAMS